MPDFLLEIGCEEIPARMINDAEMTLQARVANLFGRAGLWPQDEIDPSKIETLSTPRRLAVIIRDALHAQPDKAEQVMGPPLKVAQKDGQPTAAGEAFSKKVGVPWNQLKIVISAKGEYLAAEITKKGRTALEILAERLPCEIDNIHWPKSMYWRKRGEVFVRPVRWVVAMLDDEVIPVEVFGIKAGNRSRGHRVLADREVAIPRAGTPYVSALHDANVLSRDAREHRIRKALDAATRTIPGARWREDAALLDTVVNLTEFPSAIVGGFDPQFLALPEEVLVTVMRDHQKYFALEDSGGKLLPHFLAVLNTDRDPQGLIRHGNERVLRARFNDARFFWETDQKKSLLERLELLRHVTFQKDLGTYYEKTQRVQRLCSWLSEILKQSGMAVRPGVIHKAACLAKTDLTTELVKEFTELQGIVGGLYARVQQLDPSLPEATRFAIADTIYDHYKPESTDDEVPRSTEGAVLSIGDKADTIAGMFALGLVPSGSKDPFALRRQANGIVRTIAEHKLPAGITKLLADALNGYHGNEAEKKFTHTGDTYTKAIHTFFYERLEFYLREALGFAYGVVNATLIAGADDVVDAVARAQALAKVRPSPDFEAIAVSFKRMKNILRQAAEAGRKIAQPYHPAALKEDAEKTLAARIPHVAASVNNLRNNKKYEEALLEIARLRPPIDAFFDKVMVMVEDDSLRANRLGLLQTLLQEFSSIADFSAAV